jgi:hypothetical protein
MPGEKAIHIAVFILLLIGICAVIGWASYTYLVDALVLQIAGIALGWGVTLLVLYVVFKQLNWDWWS